MFLTLPDKTRSAGRFLTFTCRHFNHCLCIHVIVYIFWLNCKAKHYLNVICYYYYYISIDVVASLLACW